MAYKTDKTSKELKIMLNENTVESKELKELIVDLVQFSIIKGKSIKAVFKADKGHLHHRLMKRGYTQKQAVLILYGLTATLGMFAIILLESGIWKALSFALLVIAIIAIGYKDIFRVKQDDIETIDETHIRTDK